MTKETCHIHNKIPDGWMNSVCITGCCHLYPHCSFGDKTYVCGENTGCTCHLTYDKWDKWTKRQLKN